ncbi:MAG: family 2 glycosyl transferase [Parcubacteria group bacterium Gr01-1014_48]|nr:MAG: family 2 glycosyl transferase [Parcubacteria group bacterium Greene0416_14]TSC71996.1 MAG: family 2 glycosyl transferase [Parcubacteria group bacterium Gr01-1014_48]TSD00867.1 MAG: family 2 glycosyl transferase [Parcubacteria group bacterium Greene1014_15]TSD07949.1 MAG: family 2 glycosyl transferase [Parcubacteria group bacterium Greene0714_4]
MSTHFKHIASTVIFFVSLYIITALVFYFAVTKEYTPLDDFMRFRLVILFLFAPIIIKYIFHLLIAPWYPVVESLRSRKRGAIYTPRVSVLIPAWNEEVGIRATITSVLKTRYPYLEIIVINDGSTDHTHDVVTQFITRYRKKYRSPRALIRYVRISNGGKARALNRGLAMARGDIIITIDADSVMDQHAIKNMVQHFTDSRIASVAGNVSIGNRSKPIGLVQQLEYVYGFYFKRADSLLNAVYIVGGAAAAYRKKIILALGGFDEDIITEDIELSTRLQDHGYHVRYAANAIVYTEGPSDFKGLCRQRLRWKLGRFLTFYKYRRLFFSSQKQHNFYLSFFILPIALFAEILLFFEGILLLAFYTYTFYTNDFAPLAFVILLLTGVICLQISTDRNARFHRNLFLLAPIAWLLFYFMDLVEYQALIRSIRRLHTKEKLSWQKWVRVGGWANTLKKI